MSNTRKRKAPSAAAFAWLSDKSFLQAVVADSGCSPDAGDDGRLLKQQRASRPKQQQQKPLQLELTTGAVQALLNAQETFVTQLVDYIQEAMNTTTRQEEHDEEERKKAVYVQSKHVQQAMETMGLTHLFQEAMLLQEQKEAQEKAQTDSKRPGKKGPAKAKKFTAEMEAEQERLLQEATQRMQK
jgi:hypothetical protein